MPTRAWRKSCSLKRMRNAMSHTRIRRANIRSSSQSFCQSCRNKTGFAGVIGGKMNKKLTVILVLSLLLTSCGGVTPVPPTATPTFIATVTKTSTKLPTPSPTATLSQAGKIFTIPTRHYEIFETPTPIVTPSLSASFLKINNITEEDSIHLLKTMNDYSYKNFPSYNDWWTDGFFISSQRPVALAIQEYLYRFPESPNADRLKWQLVFINAIMNGNLAGNQYGDKWMIGELQNNLNNGEVSPDNLEVILDRYWFDVAYLEPVENLFDDGKTGWFYIIVPKVWKEDEVSENQDYYWHGGLFVTVREVQPNEFQIFILNSAWSFSFGDSSVFDISDHNKNGRPEIALYIGSHSGTICGGNLLIYEWNDDRFVEITQEVINLRDCGDSIQYSKLMNPPTIMYSGIFPKHTELYIWNGNFYEFDRYANVTLSEEWRSSYSSYSGGSLSYADEVEIISAMIASGEAEKYGDAYPDYLRFRLGVAYAFQSKQTEAVNVFQELVSDPIDMTRKVFPNMAQAFMENYFGDASIYAACRNSLGVYEKALSGINRENETEIRQSILGFDFTSFDLYVFPLCDEDMAFSLAISSIPSSTESLSAELRNIGIDVIYMENLDVNLDEKADEWIVALNPYNIFIVFPYASHFQAEILNATLGADSSTSPTVDVTLNSWNDFLNPIMVIFSGRDFSILEILEGYQSKILLSDFSVTDYKIANQNSEAQVQVFYSKPISSTYYPDRPWDGYRWDPVRNTFNSDLLEYKLFILDDTKGAVEIAEKLLPLLDEWKQFPDLTSWPPLSYTYYVAGLSYELSGNTQKAAEIYWQIWHDFPESHYALMARYKLEGTTP